MDRIGKELVPQAWGMIVATHLLDGLPDPRNPPDAQDHTGLVRCITHQIKTYGIEDPLVKQESALEKFHPNTPETQLP